jgi:hypothetical protein
MKTSKESILGQSFDIKDPDTNFKEAKELIRMMSDNNWVYFGVNGTKTFRYVKSKTEKSFNPYDFTKLFKDIFKQNNSQDNNCHITFYAGDTIRLGYHMGDNMWKLCVITPQGNTGNVVLNIQETSSSFEIKKFNKYSHGKVPQGVLDTIEWCLMKFYKK